MLKVEHYARIRLAHRDGMSIRQIARTFAHSRQKIRQVLNEPVPMPYTLARPRPCRHRSRHRSQRRVSRKMKAITASKMISACAEY
jgi:transposase